MIIRIELADGREVEIRMHSNRTASVITDGKSMGLARWDQVNQYQLNLFALPLHTFEPKPSEPEAPGLHFKFKTE